MAAKWSEIRAEPITGDESVSLSPANYYGFTFRETAGSTAAVRIHDSDDNTGPLLDSVKLSAGESRTEFYPGGLRGENGVFVDIVSGTIEGSVYVERAG